MRGFQISLLACTFAIGCGGAISPRGGAPPPPPSPAEAPPEENVTGDLRVLEAPVTFTVIEAWIEDDSDLEALVVPFRDRMGEEIQEVIGETTGILSKALPEGTLGNFATDAMLWAANRGASEPVQMAITNNGGLRVPIGPGPIRVGQIYELMPFENMLTVLVLTGPQVQDLCDELAAMRGAPIAGFSFRIETEGDTPVARDIRIGGEPLNPQAEYRLVTNDFLANGGGSMTSLHSSAGREDLPVLIRDAFIDYVKEMKVINVELEGRITGGIGQ